MYSDAQIDQYLSHIGFPFKEHPADPLQLLTELQMRQLERVPFENLSLHYSTKKRLSLDPNDVFCKIVTRSRGGYCLENNNFFGQILRCLGFDCIYAAARVKKPASSTQDASWLGWSHLAILVTIDEHKYLVDVGHGSPCPTRPIPLVPNTVVAGIYRQQLRLEYKSLAEHTDKGQRVWVYSHREHDEAAWIEAYCFTDLECLPTDFETMNHFPMTSPKSIFTHNIIAQRFLMDDDEKELNGSVTLFRNRVKINVARVGTTEEILASESDRVAAIERWFRIRLEPKERTAIEGSQTELRKMASLNSWWYRFLENYVYTVPEPPPRTRTKPMEVLCIGLPRSGTESLQHALLKLGYSHTYHGWDIVYETPNYSPQWFGSLDGNTTVTKDDFDAVLGHSVAVTDAAASVFAAELIAAYPDAKVVLNYRKDLDAWHRSAKETLVRNSGNWVLFTLSCLSKELFWSWHLYERFMWPGLFRALDGNIETGIARNGKWVYREHCNMIRGLVPKERLLEWTVEDGWEPLCEFLDKPAPDEAFPHANAAAGWEDHEAALTKRYLTGAARSLALISTVFVGLGATAYMWARRNN
ncbi:hypothetical protein FDECE_3330 [Fusarium decemcellulare]|nr:hypothetical protein FDECE_3330 [Fusarium decemcellulare]